MAKERLYDFCMHCRDDRAYTLRKKIVKKEIKGKTYDFKIMVAICEECGEEMDIPGLLDLNMKAIDEQYRRAEGLVSIEDINRIIFIKICKSS